MPKIKTSKTAIKRFKISKKGKIMRKKAYDNHMFYHKSGSRKRRLEQEAAITAGDRTRIKRLIVR